MVPTRRRSVMIDGFPSGRRDGYRERRLLAERIMVFAEKLPTCSRTLKNSASAVTFDARLARLRSYLAAQKHRPSA